jgi:hypothetical protein
MELIGKILGGFLGQNRTALIPIVRVSLTNSLNLHGFDYKLRLHEGLKEEGRGITAGGGRR